MAHGFSFKIIQYIFGVSKSLATSTINSVMEVLVSTLFNEFVKLSETDGEWIAKCKAFIENHEFSCVGAWDSFYFHVSTKLKNYHSFKNRYTITSMGLVGRKKSFLHLTTVTAGSVHDARLLRRLSLFQQICRGEKMPNKTINLGDDIGEIPLLWRFSRARIVTENAYGMLRGG